LGAVWRREIISFFGGEFPPPKKKDAWNKHGRVHIQTDAHSDVLITILHFAPGVKVKAAHTQLSSVGPELIPVLGSQPAGES